MTDLRQVGHNLFSAFRQLDLGDYNMAVIHPFPENGYGLAIMNRIRKATGHRAVTVKEVLELAGNSNQSA